MEQIPSPKNFHLSPVQIQLKLKSFGPGVCSNSLESYVVPIQLQMKSFGSGFGSFLEILMRTLFHSNWIFLDMGSAPFRLTVYLNPVQIQLKFSGYGIRSSSCNSHLNLKQTQIESNAYGVCSIPAEIPFVSYSDPNGILWMWGMINSCWLHIGCLFKSDKTFWNMESV